MAPQKQNPIQLLIIEDHPIVREGFVRLFEADPGFQVCGQAGDCRNGLQSIEQCRPDVILLDLFLGGSGGIGFIEDIKRTGSRAPILVVSMHDEARYAERALQAGARGYVMKDQASEEVFRAVRTVAGGGIYVSPAINRRLIEKQAARKKPEAGPVLSNRELHVLELLAERRQTREIAEKLCLSSKTIETYYERLKIKLGCSSLRELAAYAEDEFG
jgi:DNA-binding NarL/FixJ family response regulator